MDFSDRLEHIQEYFFSKKLREVVALLQQGKPIINMGIGSPDLPPPPSVVSALRDSLTDATAHQYQNYQGIPELRQAFSTFYQQKYNVSLAPDSELLMLMGSKEGIMHISMAFTNPGDEVLIPNPGYPTYTSVTHLVQATPRYYELSEECSWLPDLQSLEQQDLTKVKMMWINYPHMPTGARASDDFFQQIVDFGIKHDILIINDNPYSFILNDTPQSILAVKNASQIALELNSLSKTFNISGWRVGVVVGNEKYIKAILKVKSNMDSGMFYGIQKGAIAALQVSDSWYQEMNATYRKRRALIFKIVEMLGCICDRDASGMFVWAKLPDAIPDALEFVDMLLYEKNVFITPGVIFGSQGSRYIRFSLCIKETEIQKVIDRLTL